MVKHFREDGVEYGVTEELTPPRTHPQTRGRMTKQLQVLDKTLIIPTTGVEFFTEPEGERGRDDRSWQ